MQNFTIFAAAAAASLGLALPALAEDTSSSMMSDDAMGAMSEPMAMSNDAMGAMSEPMAMSNDAMGAMGADNMMMTTTSGEVVAIAPGGAMGTAMMEGDKMNMTIGMSSALDHCVMFITGADGKVYQVDTSSAAAQDECMAIAK